MAAVNCTKCTILSSSLSEYKKKCSKLLSIILNELDDVKKTVPLSNVYLEQFLEKIKNDLTDVMVGLVNRQLQTKLVNLEKENENFKKNNFELEKKIQDLENKNDVFADLVDAERVAEQENASLKRKLSQIQVELDQVQRKRQKRDHEKNSKLTEKTSKYSEKSKTSEKTKISEKLQVFKKIPESEAKTNLIPLPIGCNVLKQPKSRVQSRTVQVKKTTVSRGTCTNEDKQPYKVLNLNSIPTSSSTRYSFSKTLNSLKEKTNITEPKKRQKLEHLCNL